MLESDLSHDGLLECLRNETHCTQQSIAESSTRTVELVSSQRPRGLPFDPVLECLDQESPSYVCSVPSDANWAVEQVGSGPYIPGCREKQCADLVSPTLTTAKELDAQNDVGGVLSKHNDGQRASALVRSSATDTGLVEKGEDAINIIGARDEQSDILMSVCGTTAEGLEGGEGEMSGARHCNELCADLGTAQQQAHHHASQCSAMRDDHKLRKKQQTLVTVTSSQNDVATTPWQQQDSIDGRHMDLIEKIEARVEPCNLSGTVAGESDMLQSRSSVAGEQQLKTDGGLCSGLQTNHCMMKGPEAVSEISPAHNQQPENTQDRTYVNPFLKIQRDWGSVPVKIPRKGQNYAADNFAEMQAGRKQIKTQPEAPQQGQQQRQQQISPDGTFLNLSKRLAHVSLHAAERSSRQGTLPAFPPVPEPFSTLPAFPPVPEPPKKMAGQAPQDTAGPSSPKPQPRNAKATIPSSRVLQRIKPSDLQLVRPIGEGSYGTVWLALWQGCYVAVKQPLLTYGSSLGPLSPGRNGASDAISGAEAQILTELDSFSQLEHVNLTRFIGVVEPNEKSQHVHVVTEYYKGGSLNDIIKKVMEETLHLVWVDILQLLLGIAAGLMYLHNLPEPRMHGDLHPGNVLLTHYPPFLGSFVKLADFGSCAITKAGGSRARVQNEMPNPRYCAPEKLGEKLDESWTKSDKVDVYSFAILMWQLLTFEAPFLEHTKEVPPHLQIRNFLAIRNAVLEKKRPQLPSSYSLTPPAGYIELMKRCWAHASEERPSIGQVYYELDGMLKATIDGPGSSKDRAAVDEAQAIPPLVPMLASSNDESIKKQTLTLLWTLAAHRVKNQAAIARAGGIILLVNLLTGSGKDGFKEPALRLLCCMSSDSKHGKMLVGAGVIPPLVLLLSDDTPTEFKSHVVCTLRNLTGGDVDCQQDVKETGTIRKLVGLLRNNCDTELNKDVVTVLCIMAANNAENRQAIVDAGAIPLLLSLLSSDSSDGVKEQTALALWFLAANPKNWHIMLQEKAIPILDPLWSSNSGVKERAGDILLVITKLTEGPP